MTGIQSRHLHFTDINPACSSAFLSQIYHRSYSPCPLGYRSSFCVMAARPVICNLPLPLTERIITRLKEKGEQFSFHAAKSPVAFGQSKHVTGACAVLGVPQQCPVFCLQSVLGLGSVTGRSCQAPAPAPIAARETRRARAAPSLPQRVTAGYVQTNCRSQRADCPHPTCGREAGETEQPSPTGGLVVTGFAEVCSTAQWCPTQAEQPKHLPLGHHWRSH